MGNDKSPITGGLRVINRTVPEWSPWREVEVVSVDLLGSVEVRTRDGRTHRYTAEEFSRDFVEGGAS